MSKIEKRGCSAKCACRYSERPKSKRPEKRRILDSHVFGMWTEICAINPNGSYVLVPFRFGLLQFGNRTASQFQLHWNPNGRYLSEIQTSQVFGRSLQFLFLLALNKLFLPDYLYSECLKSERPDFTQRQNRDIFVSRFQKEKTSKIGTEVSQFWTLH